MKEDALIVQLNHLVCEHPDFEALQGTALNGHGFLCVPNGLVELQEKSEVEALLHILKEEIVQAVQRNGFKGGNDAARSGPHRYRGVVLLRHNLSRY